MAFVITLDLTSREPIYEQLKNKIIKLAASGVFEAGYRLPSVRSLAKELMVNPNTVQKAYQDLEREGVIYSLPGKGSFVSEGVNKNRMIQNGAINQLRKSVKQCVIFGVAKELVISAVEDTYKEERV